MWHYTVTTLYGVLCVSKRVLLGSGLREPDVTAIAVEVAGLESLSGVLLNDDGAAGGVDEVSA
jgi:hypothetical protein